VATESWASGNRVVSERNREEFLARWTEFLQWTRDTVSGFAGAVLIRDADDPTHFTSFARWKDPSPAGRRAQRASRSVLLRVGTALSIGGGARCHVDEEDSDA
jgi:hypothetical protein